jgi:hypothetical protein
VKLNRELLPTEKQTKQEMPMSPERAVCHDIDLKNREKWDVRQTHYIR